MTYPHFFEKVVIVAPIAAQYDAISNAARNTYKLLKKQPGLDVSFITSHNEFIDVEARLVSGVSDLLRDRAFRAADLIIYGFGIYHPLIDALLVGNGRAKQIVRFHNITPATLVKERDRPIIEASFRQLRNLRHADLIWADSRINAGVLIEHGINPAGIEMLPLIVDGSPRGRLQDKSAEPIELIFVGRGVAAKGLLDGIKALGRAVAAGVPPVRLSIVGNTSFSDQVYMQQCRDAVVPLGLENRITFCGTVDDPTLGELYNRADALLIPTYHEGFCVPAIEALRTGCIPIGYDAGNMTDIVNGLGSLVPTGDVEALGASLIRLLTGLGVGLRDTAAPVLPLDRTTMSVVQFDQAAQEYVEEFVTERIERTTMQSLQSLAFGPSNPVCDDM